ncbi:MAG: PcfJ domain-containing protein [Alphaproteobacteria bacterium]|nr:PcfJ domain-containing protein [Alphaproteobacteria bacterium]
MSCKPGALKSVVAVRPATLGVTGDLPDARLLIAALSAVPATWRPGEPAAWQAFRRLLEIPRHVAAATWDISRMRELGPDWAGTMARLGGYQRLDDIRDFRQGLFGHAVIAPLHAAVDGWDVATAPPETLRLLVEVMGDLLDRRPLRRQIEASDAWHRRQGVLMRLTGGHHGRHLFWPPLTEPYRAGNGITVVPLVSSGALREEGDAMRHCVGSYDRACFASGRHVVSLRDDDGHRVSTAELVFAGDGIDQLQHRAAGNAVPADAARQALEEYRRGIAGGEIPCDRRALAEDLERRRRNEREPPSGARDGRDPAMIEALWEFYRPLLPALWRRMGADAFHQASGLAAAAAAEKSAPTTRDAAHRTPPWERAPGSEPLWRVLAGTRAGDDMAALHRAYEDMRVKTFRWRVLPAVDRPAGMHATEDELLAEWTALF